jgi:hypothetical protein
MISAFGLISAAATPAFARSVPGSYGVARGDACLIELDGSLQNPGGTACPESVTVEYPLIMDAAGWLTVTIHAWAPDPDHNIDCLLQTMSNGDGGDVYWWRTTPLSLSSFRRGDTIHLTQWVGANSASFVQCNLRQGARINVVEW